MFITVIVICRGRERVVEKMIVICRGRGRVVDKMIEMMNVAQRSEEMRKEK